jgi:hypothetical protein
MAAGKRDALQLAASLPGPFSGIMGHGKCPKVGAVGRELLTKNQVWSMKVHGLCPKTLEQPSAFALG